VKFYLLCDAVNLPMVRRVHSAAGAAAFAVFALVGPCAVNAFRVPPIDRSEPEAANPDSPDLSRSGARRELQDYVNACPSCPDERVYWPESPINVCDTNCDSDASGSLSYSCDEQCEILYSCDTQTTQEWGCDSGDSVGDRCNEPFVTSSANYMLPPLAVPRLRPPPPLMPPLPGSIHGRVVVVVVSPKMFTTTARSLIQNCMMARVTTTARQAVLPLDSP
jgi:hypothetical protein